MIVRADTSHIDAAYEIIDDCRIDLRRRGILQWDETYPTRDVVVKDVDRGQLYVLLARDVPAAVLTLDEHQPPEYATVAWTFPEPALVVHRLCVSPKAQGKGLGGQVMEFAEHFAATHQFASVRLDAYTANPQSVALYVRRGYREAGQVFFTRRPLPFYCFELDISARAARAGHNL
jgi:ribosomal protein S18 acetylase RimI-like enzyme